MPLAQLKTKVSNDNVLSFIENIKNEQQKSDCKTLLDLMQKSTKALPKMWGSSIVGFMQVHLKYESGRELEWFKIGFSPRKNALTLYGLKNYNVKDAQLFSKLGKFSEGKGCIYIKKLSDVDLSVLSQIIDKSSL